MGSYSREVSHADKVMLDFCENMNSHHAMNVRLVWWVAGGKKNNPDYFLGVAYSAYKKKAIDLFQFQDILLALKFFGCKSTYFQQILQELKEELQKDTH
jgi:hypothetical protein